MKNFIGLLQTISKKVDMYRCPSFSDDEIEAIEQLSEVTHILGNGGFSNAKIVSMQFSLDHLTIEVSYRDYGYTDTVVHCIPGDILIADDPVLAAEYVVRKHRRVFLENEIQVLQETIANHEAELKVLHNVENR